MDEAFIKKVQPNSPEAEQSVIGAIEKWFFESATSAGLQQ